jgi:hypothetical protein
VGEVLPPGSHYIKPPIAPLAHSSPSLPLFFLAWLPHLELCQRVRGNSTCQTPSRYQISSLNPSSSAALLDQIPDGIYTPYVCNSSEVPHLWHYVIASVLSHWHRGAVPPWRCGVEFFTTFRLAASASSSTHVRGCNLHDRSTRVRHRSLVNRYSITT